MLTKAKVKINGEQTEEFRISCGVKQGDHLSASLFILVIDEIVKSLDVRGNISTRLKQCCAYADDILIMAKTKQTLINTFEELKKASQKYGLIINEQKVNSYTVLINLK
jgi:hypothetical protein